MGMGDLFPDVVELIARQIVPVRRGGLYGIALDKDKADYPAKKYPVAMLELL